MQQTMAVVALLIGLAIPGLAADSPAHLMQALVEAAKKADLESFLANTSSASRRALADAEGAQKKLIDAQKTFQIALDERFGQSRLIGAPAPQSRQAVLGSLVSLELLKVEQKTPNLAQMQVKTTSRDAKGHLTTEQGAFTAVKEGGGWKLVLTNLAQGARQLATARTTIFTQMTNQIREGTFKDRTAAMIALAKAERAQVIGRRK